MSLNKIRGILLVTAMALALIVLGVTSSMSMVTFKDSYNESLASNYKVFAEQKVRKIEYAVRYGKPLNNFYGIEDVLSENLQSVDGIKEVQVVLPSGDILYNQDGTVIDKQVVLEAKEKIRFFSSKKENNSVYFVENQKYYVYSPIYDANEKWIASLGLVFDERVVTSDLNQYMNQIGIYFGIFSVITLLALFLCLYKIPILSKSNVLLKKRIIIMLLLIVGGSQITFGWFNYSSLNNGYLELVKKNTSLALSVIQSDIEEVTSKGVPYSGLYGVGEYMDGMIQFLPEVSSISILNADLTTESVNKDLFSSKYSYSSPLMEDQTGWSNYINVVELSKTFIDNKTQAILLDTMTMIILSLLLIVEMTVFILLYLERRINKGLVAKELTIDVISNEERTSIRPLSFIVFCATFISFAYIPLVMKDLYQPLLGLSKEVVLGLPIGLEVIFTLIAFILAGPFNNRKGWRSTFVIGIVVLIIGTLLSAIAWNPILFLMSRIVTGIGFGFALLAMYRYSYMTVSNRDNRDTFSQFQIGSISGMYFGIVIGAMLAERIGLFNVYFVAIPLFLAAIVFVLKFMPNKVQKRVVRRRKYYRTKEIRSTFFTNFNVIMLLLCIVIPVSATGMFLYYFIPIFADSKEITISNIGRLFLLQGLLIIYVGPLYEKYMKRLISLKSSIVISASLIAVSFLLFSLQMSFMSAIVTIALLGIAHCIGYTSQLEYFKHQNHSIELEEGKIVEYYKWYEYLGKIVGVLFFIVVYTVLGSSVGIGMLGVLILFSTLLFVLMINNTKKEEKENSSVGGQIQ